MESSPTPHYNLIFMSTLPRLHTLTVACGILLVMCLGPLWAAPLEVSGIYPSLATFNHEGECGTGAIVPWADRLWLISYGPHKPYGSTDKLYEITPDLRQIIRPESIGGTPADRMIHRESQQLIIGPYFIDTNRNVRVVPWQKMPGRLTAVARHLSDPTNKVYVATMEAGLYEVDVHSLKVNVLLKDRMNQPPPGSLALDDSNLVETRLPGWHGKGLYSGQGRLVFSNNGEHGKAAETNPDTVSGALGEWFGSGDYQLVRRAQFTDITGPGGIFGNPHPATDPLWSIGFDRRSLILLCLDGGHWTSYRLPKPSHTYDGAHGWHTEWPRIRDIGESDWLMTMHGGFWRFPPNFSPRHSAGIVLRSTYLCVLGDFCRWQDRIVLGCDMTAQSEFFNGRKAKGHLLPPGQSQSNLQFVKPESLDDFGPALGRGAVWLDDSVKAEVPSEPFLFDGFTHRLLTLLHNDSYPVTFTLQVDERGDGQWKSLRSVLVQPGKPSLVDFPPNQPGTWVRLVTDQDCTRATAYFQYRNDDTRPDSGNHLFDGVAQVSDQQVSGALLHVNGDQRHTLGCATHDGYYELDGDLKLCRVHDETAAATIRTKVAIPTEVLHADAASMLYVDETGHRWRLPKGDPAVDSPGALGAERVDREVVTERDLFNCSGTFYELPGDSSGGFGKIRPICTHNRRIKDFASYRGMLVLSGITDTASGGHIVRSDDGKLALWVGALDDLWRFGKPHGHGGPWANTAVKAHEPSDAYLCSGFDHKILTLSHDSNSAVTFTIEADLTGAGKWCEVSSLTVPPGQKLQYRFPESFGAYWLRVISPIDTTATAQLDYF